MQPIAEPLTVGGALRVGWGRLFQAMRRPVRGPITDIQPSAAAPIDAIALTVLAVNRLGPATLRAVSLGVPVTVAVPDCKTAAIFQAALSEMRKARPTDRLVSVELTSES
jgi:hypothetical protein